MKTNHDLDALFSRICDGTATATEIARFHELLSQDTATLDAWLRYTALHAELAAGSALAGADRPPESITKDAVNDVPALDHSVVTRRPWRFQWIPQAAAGLVIGCCAASLVWAYVSPVPVKVIPLLEETFESPELPIASRSALDPETWRGDGAEIVGAQNGITPLHGSKMLRLRRTDFDSRPKPAGGHIAVVYRLIDLRPHQSEVATGNCVVEVSASFNAAEFPEAERYGCAISLYALDADSVPDRAGRLGTVLSNDALAMARSSRVMLDRAPQTWQRATSELRLPPQAEFLAVRLHISQPFATADESVFTGSYVDDVQVSLTLRPPTP